MNEIIIEVKNISKVYDEMTDNPVISLNNISMSIEKGEFICVMGTSGSGKTTFINCISTMDTPSKGQVILFGKSTLEMIFVVTIVKTREKDILIIGKNINTSLD